MPIQNKILIIEDDRIFSEVLKQKFTNLGFNVDSAGDGSTGLEKIRTFSPDLVILDIMLPGLNGYEVLEAKRKDPTITNIPVIVVSNSGQAVEIKLLQELGIKDYIIKMDFEPEEVLEKVFNYLSLPVEKDSASKGSGAVLSSKSDLPENRLKSTLPSGIKVFIVEDDKLLSDLLIKKIGAVGWEIAVAIDGSEAIAAIREKKPDIVLLDILLPGMDGFEVLKVIKHDENLREIPVILLSNLGQEKDISHGKELGAASYLIKASVTLDEVVDEIAKVLNFK